MPELLAALSAPPAVERHWCDDAAAGGPLVRPPVIGPRTRLTVVMHGVMRNGVDYAQRWAPFAARANRVVLAPEFDGLRWPGARSYNLGKAMAQGPHRFARAAWMLEQVRRVDPRSPWRPVDVPDVGHDDRLMARASWPLLTGCG